MRYAFIILLSGCTDFSDLVEPSTPSPPYSEEQYQVKSFCTPAVEAYDEDAGKWLPYPYPCRK